MDKNLAALLREDTRTVHVRFDNVWVAHAYTDADNIATIMEEHTQNCLEIQRRAAEAEITARQANTMVRESLSKRDEALARAQPQTAASTGRPYTYIATGAMDVQPGAIVVVEASEDLKLARVVRVDDSCKIEPNSQTHYKWVVSVVNVDAYKALLAKNAEIETQVAQVYRQNLRQAFRQQILGGITDEARLQIENLLK